MTIYRFRGYVEGREVLDTSIHVAELGVCADALSGLVKAVINEAKTNCRGWCCKVDTCGKSFADIYNNGDEVHGENDLLGDEYICDYWDTNPIATYFYNWMEGDVK